MPQKKRPKLGNPQFIDKGPYCPTEEEIKRAMEEIRSHWSKAEEMSRSMYDIAPPVEVRQYQDPRELFGPKGAMLKIRRVRDA